MKKLIIIFILLLSLTGCYDYYELNELAIVIGIGIDYKDDEYEITYEVISNNVAKESANTKSYTVTEKNANFPIAMDLTSDSTRKRAYFSHTDLLVISKTIAENHLEDILDYLLRNNNIRETLQIVIAENPKELLSNTSENLPVISSSINDALDADKYSGSYAIKKKYINMAQELLTFGEDTALSIVNVNKNKIEIEDMAIFHNYKLVNYLDKKYASLYNLLNNETNNVILYTEYNDKIFSNSIFRSNIKIDVTKDTIKIDGDVESQVLENQPNFDLQDPQIITEIEKTFSYILNEEITQFIEILQDNKSDILYLGQNYYNHSRDKNNKLWPQAKIESNVKFQITKKGIIYEVKDAN